MIYDWEKLQTLRASIPEIDALFLEHHRLLAASMQAALAGEDPQCLERERQRFIQKMEQKMPALLSSHGLDGQAFLPRYACPRCQDKGYVLQEGQKRLCTCQLAKRADAQSISCQVTFEQFDPALIPEGPQRTALLRHRSALEDYVRHFPNTGKQNLLLIGSVGLGKSFLLSCVVNSLKGRQIPVRFVTAYQLNQLFRSQHFGEQDCLVSLIRIPFLAIDDLGTEPVLRNITIEYFYTLLEERLRQGKHTAMATNLTVDQLRTHYGERIASRLFAQDSCDSYVFAGRDLRLLPRG